jgi:hypothetical protein
MYKWSSGQFLHLRVLSDVFMVFINPIDSSEDTEHNGVRTSALYLDGI